MDRLIAPNSVPFANADTAPATGTPQYATEGNPLTSTPATVFPAYAWNMLQDEIYNVIIAAGLTPNRSAWNQLLTAIETMLQGGTTNVGVDTGAANAYVVAFTPALPNPVPWAPFWFKVKTTNTGASTLNATGTVEPLVGAAHAALQGNEMVANGNALVYWNPTLASGAGSYVLLFCSGASEQIAPATEPLHAVQLQQVGNRTGEICFFPFSTPPTGFLPSDGSAVSRTTYATLFAAIGTTYGAGDGATTFNVPDMRGYFPRGWDNGAGRDPGRALGSVQADSFASHNHTATDSGHSHTYPTSNGAGGGQFLLGVTNQAPGTSTTGVASANITVGSAGGTETRPKNVALLACIKY